ncbi:MAG: alpha/beta hydrolase [Deltaproteobacteria bacterium]|nr:alpha/beta hydrolase [Deltaproteobacteria bacterium]
MSHSSTILDHPIVSSRYFFPQRASIPEPYWVEAADGSRLACSYQAVNPDAKTVVYFHGNGEVVADYVPEFPAWIARAGCNCLLAEYRGYGMSTGTPALAGMLEDVVPIIHSLNIPDRQIVLFGRSIGSLYALHGVYRRPQLGGLIIESGVADLTQRFFQRVLPEELGMSRTDVVDELRKYFDYAQKLGNFQGQTLVMHTRFDELIDAHHAEMLYTAAREPKQLKIFDQGGHNDIFFRNRTEYMQLVEALLAAV